MKREFQSLQDIRTVHEISTEHKSILLRKARIEHLFGEVVVDDKRVLAVVTEVLAHRAARVRREVLQRRGVAGSGGHDDRVLERVRVLQALHDLRHCTALLADGHVDAVELLLLVARVVEALLVDDRVDGEGGLPGLTVADDQLALSATDWYQAVHGFDTCKQNKRTGQALAIINLFLAIET